MAGRELGEGSYEYGYSEWIMAAWVGVMLGGWIPQARRDQ